MFLVVLRLRKTVPRLPVQKGFPCILTSCPRIEKGDSNRCSWQVHWLMDIGTTFGPWSELPKWSRSNLAFSITPKIFGGCFWGWGGAAKSLQFLCFFFKAYKKTSL